MTPKKQQLGICIAEDKVYNAQKNNQWEVLEAELDGQGFINKEQTQHVGVHLLKKETVIDKLNGMISTNKKKRKIPNNLATRQQIYYGFI